MSSAVGTPQPGSGSRASWDTSDECLPMVVPREAPHLPHAEMPCANLPIPTAQSPYLFPYQTFLPCVLLPQSLQSLL